MQINRLFEIIYILLEKKIVTAKELSEKFEVSQRTIYRDIETLSEAGIPIYMSKGKGGGISLLPNFILNKAFLTEQEKADIISSLKAVSAVNITKSDETLDKLGNMLGNDSADWIEVNFEGWGNTKNEAGNFSQCKTAIFDKHKITFNYASGKLEQTQRSVFPLKLVFKRSAWYLYAYCTLRCDYRFFKLKRINDIVISDETFDMKAPKVLDDNYSTDEFKYYSAVLEISPALAFRVYDEIADYDVLENGNFLCRIKLPTFSDVCTYAASYGEYCTVIEPVEVKTELRGRIERMLKKYS